MDDGYLVAKGESDKFLVLLPGKLVFFGWWCTILLEEVGSEAHVFGPDMRFAGLGTNKEPDRLKLDRETIRIVWLSHHLDCLDFLVVIR